VTALGAIVMAIRFACELAALAITAWWGHRSFGIAAAICAPALVGILWGLWIAPRATKRLRDPLRFGVESVVWASAIAALVALDRPILAAGFGVAAFGTAIGARRFEPEVSNRDGSSRARNA